MRGRSGERSLRIEGFDGGLNLWEEESRLGKNESPEMKNLWWEGGILCCRPGQSYITGEMEGGVGYAASEPFWDSVFLHISSSLYRLDHSAAAEGGFYTLEEVRGGVPRDRGTFFRYGEYLYYKNRGGFYQIAYTPMGERLFTVTAVEEMAYVPTIVLNASPLTGSGDLYQPENRLTGRKRVKYNASVTTKSVSDSGDGAKRIFLLGTTAENGLAGVEAVYFGANLVSTALYECNAQTGTVTFTAAPENGTEITFVLDFGLSIYKLPEGDVEAVEEVRVEGALLEEGADYTVDLIYGAVTFMKAPQRGDPPVNNTVEILYRKENAAARESIMSCRCGGVYGGGVQVCMVLGGCEAQPNAIFWNGNDDIAMNPGYFPMPFYNLCGDASESVSGFGRQYTELIVFKERSIGKAGFGVEEVNGRDSISLTYERVNDKVGCDLPWSIQLVENNLVFANTSGGVYTLRSASAAYENNVALISRAVNGSGAKPALLYDLQVTRGTQGTGFDDGQRYWLTVNGHAYVWDYRLSSAERPCWFYFTAVRGESWWQWEGKTFHLNGEGRVTRLGGICSDYGEGIEKVYRLPAMALGGYERRKDVSRLLLTLDGGREEHTSITYLTDEDVRTDPTPIRTSAAGLVPRDLTKRDLHVKRGSVVAVRKPLCRNIARFSVQLSNSTAGEDLTLQSVEIIYRMKGRER